MQGNDDIVHTYLPTVLAAVEAEVSQIRKVTGTTSTSAISLFDYLFDILPGEEESAIWLFDYLFDNRVKEAR